jgi:hypothetical protein
MDAGDGNVGGGMRRGQRGEAVVTIEERERGLPRIIIV